MCVCVSVCVSVHIGVYVWLCPKLYNCEIGTLVEETLHMYEE